MTVRPVIALIIYRRIGQPIRLHVGLSSKACSKGKEVEDELIHTEVTKRNGNGEKNCGIQSFSYPTSHHMPAKEKGNALSLFPFLWSLEQPRLCDILTLSNTHIIPIWKLFWSFHDIKRDRWGIGSLDPLLVYSLPPLRIRLLKWSGFACTLYWPARLPRPYLACEFPSLLLACEFCQNHEMFWATCLL